MSCHVHNVRFYTPVPAAIHCMTYQSSGNKLALSRNNASIEIWDLKGAPMMCRKIFGDPSGSIEAICWIGERLLSTGLSGAVIEWDLDKLSIKNSVLVTGQAAWCIDVTKNNDMLAVGTEQGYINLFNVENDTFLYEKLFDKQEGRILCCKFDKSGEFLVTGSIETIRIWNVATGQALHRMTTGRSKKKKETIVWCLDITPDLTIISGDSRGHLTFWDGKLGEQIESLETHKADVLAIAFSEDYSSLYCAGVDPLVINYTKVKMKQKGEQEYQSKWVKNIQRNIHQHDVRSMVMRGNKLFTGGVDGYLASSSFPPKVLVKYPPISNSDTATFCKKTKLLCLRYENYIEIWKLGVAHSGSSNYSLQEDGILETDNVLTNGHSEMNGEKETSDIENEETNSGRRLKLSEAPKFILRLSGPSNLPLICYAISPDTKWIAYSTDSHFRIFKFSFINDSPTLSKLVPLPDDCTPCYKMAFGPDSNTLIVALADGTVKILYIHNDGAVTVDCNLDTISVVSSSKLLHLNVSDKTAKNSCFMVLSDINSNVGVWEIKLSEKGRKTPTFIAQIPRYEFVPSSVAVDSRQNNLIVTYTDQKIVEYDLIKLKFTKWSKSINNDKTLGAKWYGRLYPILGISPHPVLPNILMLYDSSNLYVINKDSDSESNTQKNSKKFKRNNAKAEEKVPYTSKKYRHLVSAGWVTNENDSVECAVVVADPANLLEKLPPMFYKPHFGCM